MCRNVLKRVRHPINFAKLRSVNQHVVAVACPMLSACTLPWPMLGLSVPIMVLATDAEELSRETVLTSSWFVPLRSWSNGKKPSPCLAPLRRLWRHRSYLQMAGVKSSAEAGKTRQDRNWESLANMRLSHSSVLASMILPPPRTPCSETPHSSGDFRSQVCRFAGQVLPRALSSEPMLDLLSSCLGSTTRCRWHIPN